MGTSLLSASRELVARIAGDVGTPVYIYDASAIRERYCELTRALASIPHHVFYSVKANSNLAILDLLRSLGAGADIVSGGELARALRAGFEPEQIIFSGVGKTPAELDSALRAGVGVVNVESFAELRALRAIADEQGVVARFGIRVNPDVTTNTHPYTQTGGRGMKFGVPMDEVMGIAQWALRQSALEQHSIGMHIGSQILESGEYREGADKLARIVDEIRAAGVHTLRNVDVGGGLGIRYTTERPLDPVAFAEAIQPLARSTDLPLVVEPGRYLVGNAGLLVTRCLYRKRMGGREFAVVDAGMSDLLRPSLYRAEHEIQLVCDGDPTGVVKSDGADDGPVDVVGPICETGDFLGVRRDLPGVRPGSLLAVLAAGAYAFTMSSTYNSRPRAAEVLVDGDRWAVIRQRESVERLMWGERTLDEVDVEGWRTVSRERGG